MFRRLGCVLAIVATAWAWSAAADSDNEPTQSDLEACQPDIHRLCEKFFPDERLVAFCLIDRRAELSIACAEVLARPQGPADAPSDPSVEPKPATPAKP